MGNYGVLGAYIAHKSLDIADLAADGSFALGGCVLCRYGVKQRGGSPGSP